MRRRRDEGNAGLGVAKAGDFLRRFVPGQLTTLARLGSLSHLDLQLVGKDAVFRGYAEAPGGHLLDPRVAVDRQSSRPKARRVLSSLTGVAFAAQPIHRDRDRLVRLGGNGTVRHGPRGESPQDAVHRLYRLHRKRRAGRSHRQQVARIGWRPVGNQPGEPLVRCRRFVPGSVADGTPQRVGRGEFLY